jgi:hypothetical protein
LRLVSLLELREGRSPLKKVHVGPLQMAQSLLQRDTRDLVQKSRLRLVFERGQLPRHLRVGRPMARLLVGVDREPQGPVVGVTQSAERASKDLFLLFRWVKAIDIGAFDDAHVLLFSRKAEKVAMAPSLPHTLTRGGLFLPRRERRGLPNRRF